MTIYQIQIRRGTAAEWVSANTTLESGEMGYESDTDKLKFGNGTTAWNSLSYFVNDKTIQFVADATYYILQTGSTKVLKIRKSDGQLFIAGGLSTDEVL